MTAKSLYVHIPFCTAKCDYCDFFSRGGSTEVDDGYVRALLREARYYARLYQIDSFKTVYIGGGTPSLLSAGQLSLLLGGLRRIAGGAQEITVEMNPETVDEDRLLAAAEGGANRLSLGIQSLDGRALRAVLRRCSAARAVEAIELVKRRWQGRLNLDVMAGLPGQDAEAFCSSLERLLVYGPEHFSLYTLTVEEGTPLAARIDGGMDWSGDEADDEWLLGRDMLRGRGYVQYEVSNFALPSCESRHNLAYWRQEDYVGIGAGAVGTVYGSAGADGLRWTNTRDIAAYTAFWQQDADPSRAGDLPRSVERLSPEVQEFEFFMMGLRTREGLSAADYRRRYAPVSPWHGDIALRLGARGGLWRRLLAEGKARTCGTAADTRYCLTEEGLLFLNDVLRRL